MLNFTKLLKIGLPVATVTTATIITATLLFSKRDELKDNNDNKDRVLDDYEKPLELYQEEIINKPEESDNKEELNEQEKKAEEKIKQELEKDPNTKSLIKELFEDPEKLAEKLSLENKLNKAQLEKIASRIPELAEQSQNTQQIGAPTQEDEEVLSGGPDAKDMQMQKSSEDAVGKEPDENIVGKGLETPKPKEIAQDLTSPPTEPNLEEISPSLVEKSDVDLADSEEEDLSEDLESPEGSDGDSRATLTEELSNGLDSQSRESEGSDTQAKGKTSVQRTEGEESDALNLKPKGEKGDFGDGKNEEEGSANSITDELLREMEEITGRASDAISYLENLLGRSS